MTSARQAVAPALRQFLRPTLQQNTCCRCTTGRSLSTTQFRLQGLETDGSSSAPPDSVNAAPPKSTRGYDPLTVVSPRRERQLLRKRRLVPIGSRRARAARSVTPNIPFSQLPYQCFQEARKVLAADREEKIKQIITQRERLARLTEQDAAVSGGQRGKETRIRSMQKHLEELKIFADINDPLVKKKFEDGLGDMNKPIYRHLADKEWRSYKRKILMQRVEQLGLVPDVLPAVDPVIDIDMQFGRNKVGPGEKVSSALSERPPLLQARVFDKGERLVTVVVVDSDVPDVEAGDFYYRCHGIFTNLSLSPTQGRLDLPNLTADQVVLPWVPPTSQKGAPYHRLSLWLLEHPRNGDGNSIAIDAKTAGGLAAGGEERFNMRSFVDKLRVQFGRKTQHFNPVGVTVFRTQWDETMDEVMKRAGVPGWELEFKNEKPQKLPYKKKDPKRYR